MPGSLKVQMKAYPEKRECDRYASEDLYPKPKQLYMLLTLYIITKSIRR